MLSKFPSKKEQRERAKLISPFFQYLKTNKFFLLEVENIRIKYGLIKSDKTEHEVPIFLLKQNFWKKDSEGMSIVLSFPPKMVLLWEKFHADIEEFAIKFRLKNFPNLLKDYVLTNHFDNLLTSYRLTCSSDGFDIQVSRGIKKKDFNKIWNAIQIYNKENPESVVNYQRFSDEVLEKYSSVEKISRKYFADQKDILILIEKGLQKESSIEVERKIKGWHATKKSRLTKIVNDLFSLIDDFNDAEI